MNKEEIFEILEESTAAEVDEYLDAVLNRKQELYPDWEFIYLALPTNDPQERERIIGKVREMK